MRGKLGFCGALIAAMFCFAASAQAEPGQVNGPAQVKMRGDALCDVPAKCLFVEEAQAKAFLEKHNPPDPTVIGMLVHEEEKWMAVFSYEDIGYVKDEDRDAFKSDAKVSELLDYIRQGTEEANKWRRQHNAPEMRLVGWEVRPEYDSQLNKLIWGVQYHDQANYSSKVLGRHGVVSIELIGDVGQSAKMVGALRNVTNRVTFAKGATYAEWTSGDKVAAVGLTGLVAVGAAAAVAKNPKAWKAIIAIGAAALAGIGWVFKKIKGLFGGGE